MPLSHLQARRNIVGGPTEHKLASSSTTVEAGIDGDKYSTSRHGVGMGLLHLPPSSNSRAAYPYFFRHDSKKNTIVTAQTEAVAPTHGYKIKKGSVCASFPEFREM